MPREEIEKLIKKAVKNSFAIDLKEVEIERPLEERFGDYTTNIALKIAKKLKKDSKQVANKITQSLNRLTAQSLISRVEAAGAGFINFFLADDYLQKQVAEILKKKKNFGSLKFGQGKKVNVEFISANPTGPLTLGNGRGGFCGDVLANVLAKAGYKVQREYYINDVGEQIRKLGHSVLGDSEAVYKGKYIDELRKRVKGGSPDEVGQKAAKIVLEEFIKPTVKKMGISFDTWFSEKSLNEKGKVDEVLKFLKNKNLAYEKEGALWFRSSRFGDDKDRVLVKADEEKSYFASDIAYLKNKFERGFDCLIYFLGADHYGYVKRMQAAVQALGYKKEQAKFVVMQLVRLFKGGQQVRMSKREGVYVTLDELIDEIGLDVTRFFFLQRSPGSHLNFDLELAKVEGEKNPVYYVQYAHARICSILRKAKGYKIGRPFNFVMFLKHPSELRLIKHLMRFPEVVEDTAQDYQVQRLPQYAMDLATAFHQFYVECQVLSADKELSRARVGLITATGIVLKNTLALMGVSAPERM